MTLYDERTWWTRNEYRWVLYGRWVYGDSFVPVVEDEGLRDRRDQGGGPSQDTPLWMDRVQLLGYEGTV